MQNFKFRVTYFEVHSIKFIYTYVASNYKGIAQVASIIVYQTSHSHVMENFHQQCHYFLLLHFSIHLFAMADFLNLVETIMILCPHLSHPKSNCVPCNNTLQHQVKRQYVNWSLAKAP